uniref:lysophospholipid acyltransferase 7-like n=1 Tax=Styela clava TaxID=7725 RepID=UPI0019397696|nr:lysophospholipid acyltransferase 7-like [Styela clava]XP_039268254.1 lysophospholipid acyltransferase 7-like [Styela clava]
MTFYDEIVYVLILSSSVASGLLLRSVENSRIKQLLSSSFGLLVVLFLCGWETLHSILSIIGTLCIIKSHNKQTPLLAFIFVFSYLLFFRCSTLFGLPKSSAVGNAVQLLLTLKLISVAIEIHDYRQRKSREKSKDDTPSSRFQLSLQEEPNTYDIICYSYCYVGLFTGPFYKFRTYQDFLDQTVHQSQVIPWKEEILIRFKQISFYAVMYFIATVLFSVDHVRSDAFYESSFLYRLVYMVPIFFLGRMRFYSAWLLAECSFITAAFGAYPKSSNPKPGHGPTVEYDSTEESESIEYSFETIRNINPEGSEWSKTVRDGMRNWNMTVQWWLANYVGKRWPAHLKQFRTAAVLGCSAYWHGIAPGYFGAFLTMPFVMFAEDLLSKLVRQKLNEGNQLQYDWLNWFFKMRSFEYMYMAFALLTWEDTYRWWKSVYFIGHVVCLLVILSCTVVQLLLSKPKKVKKEE